MRTALPPALPPQRLIDPRHAQFLVAEKLSRYAAAADRIPADAVLETLLAVTNDKLDGVRSGGNIRVLSTPCIVSQPLSGCIETVIRNDRDLWRNYAESVRSAAEEDLDGSVIEAFLVMRLFETCPPEMIRNRPFMSINVNLRGLGGPDRERPGDSSSARVIRATLAGAALYSRTAILTPETWDLLYSPSAGGQPIGTESHAFVTVLMAALLGAPILPRYTGPDSHLVPFPILEAADTYLSEQPPHPAAERLFSRSLLEAINTQAIPLDIPGPSLATWFHNKKVAIAVAGRVLREPAAEIPSKLGYPKLSDLGPQERVGLAVIHNAWKNRNEWFTESEEAFAGLLRTGLGLSSYVTTPIGTASYFPAMTRDEWKRFGGNDVYSRYIHNRKICEGHPYSRQLISASSTLVNAWAKSSSLMARPDESSLSVGAFISGIPRKDWDDDMKTAVAAAVRDYLDIPRVPWGNSADMMSKIPGEKKRIMDLFASEIRKCTGTREEPPFAACKVLSNILDSRWIDDLAMEGIRIRFDGVENPVFFDVILEGLERCGAAMAHTSGAGGKHAAEQAEFAAAADRRLLSFVNSPRAQGKLIDFFDTGNADRVSALSRIVPLTTERIQTLVAVLGDGSGNEPAEDFPPAPYPEGADAPEFLP